HRNAGGSGASEGLVPFHKLTQWLAYSLFEPFEWAGIAVTDRDALTALAEYRNGGLLVDSGVLQLANGADRDAQWAQGDEIVVEWRALTVTLIDELAQHVRAELDRPQLPLIQHKLTLMRRRETSTTNFRRLLNEIGSLMAYEVTRDAPMNEVTIETPLETMRSRLIDGKKLVFVPILRAGTGLLDGFLNVVPGARVGHVGLYRDPRTLVAVEYYFKLPGGMHERD